MKLHFRAWVEMYGGISKLAKDLEVSDHAVRWWLRGDGLPSSSTVIKILMLSKGSISYEHLYKETTRRVKKCKHQ